MKIRIQFDPNQSRNLLIRLFSNARDTEVEIQSDATSPSGAAISDLIELEILMRPA
ncbi:MAG: hypothetical protein OHK0047_39130 [Leptolyngbyaceae cyanobacterium]|uniref:hypothetical protein n=1 Tax=Leptodesmis sp. TaxID=3100501 RepID=UPI003D133A36